MLNNKAAYKYEILFKGPFVITQFWTNIMFTVKYSATKIRYNIRRIKPYKYDANFEDISTKNMYYV